MSAGSAGLRQLEFLNWRLSKDAFRAVCDLIRDDMLQIAGEIAACWTEGRTEQAKAHVHALKGVFGDIGHEAGMAWCDRIRRESPAPPIEALHSSLQREMAAAMQLLAALSGSPGA